MQCTVHWKLVGSFEMVAAIQGFFDKKNIKKLNALKILGGNF